jgi:GntR family transcriptional repressor for pyruvate dehydrogenase complex
MEVVSETVQKYVSDLIRKKNLQPGAQLPSERELAKILGVGRSSVREALQALSEKGIVVKKAGKGVFVKRNPATEGTEFSRSLAMSMDITHSLDLLEVRKAIEVEIATLAAKRIQTQQLLTLEQSLVDLEVCMKMGTSIIVPDLVFHGTLAQATNNEMIIQIYNSISEFFKKIRIEMAVYDDVQNALYYHQQMFAALKKGDAENCSKLMREHIEDVQRHYHEMLRDFQASSTKVSTDRRMMV